MDVSKEFRIENREGSRNLFQNQNKSGDKELKITKGKIGGQGSSSIF